MEDLRGSAAGTETAAVQLDAWADPSPAVETGSPGAGAQVYRPRRPIKIFFTKQYARILKRTWLPLMNRKNLSQFGPLPGFGFSAEL